MRSQMIEWMMDDLLPQIRQNHHPESTLLKFAHEKNLSSSLLEGLGQLYNTAKTLSFLEKSANRGATFPILDVPAMVDKFMEVPVTKKASAYTPEVTTSLASCFEGIVAPMVKLASVVEPSQINPVKRAWAEQEKQDMVLDFTKQARFEFVEDARAVMVKIARRLRETNVSFTSLEQDALYTFGEGSKPVMDKLAHYLERNKFVVKRAADAGKVRLVRDEHKFLPEFEALQDCFTHIEVADEILKSATNVLEEMATPPGTSKSDPPPKSDAPPLMAGGSGARRQQSGKDNGGRKTVMQDEPDKKPNPGGGDKGRDGTFFGPISTAMNKPLSHMAAFAQRAAPTFYNKDQQDVDHGHRDVQHIALLQNLMTTDEVLAEADPDKVVDMFNTVRANAPQLAGDANVMRVILRSAIQHDGVSPFDLKGFLDTEQSKQKVDLGNRQMDAHLYKGKDLAGSRGTSNG